MFLKEWIVVLISFLYSKYILLFRSLIKPIIFIITKTHEIDRIINAKNTSEYSKYISLVKYINRSKVLQPMQLFINNTKPHSNEEIDDLVVKITKAKQLSQSTAKQLRILIAKSNRILNAKEEILSQSNANITLDNERHKDMLLDIWNHLCPNKPINVIDKQWLSIGFQGSNPLTDFRGSGLLGLKQLHHFVVAEERMNEVYQVAINEKTWYFFAAAGINISGNLIDFIQKGNCDELFFENIIDTLAFSHSFYAELFYGFNAMWIERKYTDYMKFNTALDEFMKERANGLYKKIAVEYTNKQSKVY